jgi:hypothetical protein
MHHTNRDLWLSHDRSAGISTLGWWLGLASVTNFIAAMIAGIAVLNNPDYVIERWHIWLLFVAVTWMAIGLNIFATRWLPVWNQFIRTFLSMDLFAGATPDLDLQSTSLQLH